MFLGEDDYVSGALCHSLITTGIPDISYYVSIINSLI